MACLDVSSKKHVGSLERVKQDYIIIANKTIVYENSDWLHNLLRTYVVRSIYASIWRETHYQLLLFRWFSGVISNGQHKTAAYIAEMA